MLLRAVTTFAFLLSLFIITVQADDATTHPTTQQAAVAVNATTLAGNAAENATTVAGDGAGTGQSAENATTVAGNGAGTGESAGTSVVSVGPGVTQEAAVTGETQDNDLTGLTETTETATTDTDETGSTGSDTDSTETTETESTEMTSDTTTIEPTETDVTTDEVTIDNTEEIFTSVATTEEIDDEVTEESDETEEATVEESTAATEPSEPEDFEETAATEEEEEEAESEEPEETEPDDITESEAHSHIFTEKTTMTTATETDYSEYNEATDRIDADESDILPPECDSAIYCQGKLLETVQMARIFDDSKHFVDMTMMHDPGTIMTSFEAMMNQTGGNPDKGRIQKFVNNNFKSQNEVESWVPDDYNESPCFIGDIGEKDVKKFTSSIISLWKTLGKKVADDVFYHPERHSLVPVPYGFISSGGRYGEYYYWDNYWIADALIICGMTDTVKGIIDNFVGMIIKYGFVPNGGRKYYGRRSQPPLLPFIVMRYYEETTDVLWLQRYIEYFEQEMQFWVHERRTHVVLDTNVYSLWIYKSESAGPRPEAYYEDATAGQYYEDESEREAYYNNIKASAESGWDSSSRWVFDAEGGTEANLTFSKPSRVIPVDLNAYLYGAFTIMSKLYLDLENYGRQTFWRQRATELYMAINKVLWNDEDGIWYDYDMDFDTHRKHFYASNLAPLWTGAYNTTWCKKQNQIHRILEYLQNLKVLDFPGGIPSSLQNTGKQWDMPNVWPPLQSIIANGFDKSGVPEAKAVALEIAQKYVKATMKSFEQGAMYQRYDANNVGQPGPGGEYETQKVFAWTNAVAIQFVHKFYT